MSTEPYWISIARKYLGTKEIPGKGHHKLILKWWSMIRAPFTDDETPWCAGFVGGVLEEAKFVSTRSAWARSYLGWGQKLSRPVVGCVVVFERGPKSGHVGFVLGQNKNGNLIVLGGNQSDMVCIKPFEQGRVLGYRWPPGLKVPQTGDLPIIAYKGALSSNEA